MFVKTDNYNINYEKIIKNSTLLLIVKILTWSDISTHFITLEHLMVNWSIFLKIWLHSSLLGANINACVP